MDEARLTPEEAAKFRGRAYAALPFADPGRGTDGARDACQSWPAQPKPPYSFPAHISGLPPTLTISITSDPSTPFSAGVHLSRTLGGSMLTVKGEQHTVVGSATSACVGKAVADYLISLRVPHENASCTM
ncbi:alpha/beta hydrolase [Streptomyces sp. NPDC058459]|uniref:alpha/beta hydrolase n=1 Tax=Streptomyces sp. NPDC058459 TaxID=3346508 RepID=UPI003650A3A5